MKATFIQKENQLTKPEWGGAVKEKKNPALLCPRSLLIDLQVFFFFWSNRPVHAHLL